MVKISALILAKNEERNIKACIETLSFVDDILVIDDFSTDKTKAIAEKLGARVIQHSMNGDWGAQQTFAIQNAKYERIFRRESFGKLFRRRYGGNEFPCRN